MITDKSGLMQVLQDLTLKITAKSALNTLTAEILNMQTTATNYLPMEIYLLANIWEDPQGLMQDWNSEN